MTKHDVDRTLEAWLEGSAPHRLPNGLLEAIERDVRRQRPKRRWHALLTEPSMRDRGRITFGSPVARTTAGLLLVVALAVLGVAAVAVGSRMLPRPTLPAVEPANGMIAFDSSAKIMAADAGGGNVRVLVGTVADAASPTWSPDGRVLAFWGASPSGEGDALYVVGSDGGSPRVVADHLWIATDKRPAWSPDGSELVFSSESGPDKNDEDLYLVRLDGSGKTKLGRDHLGDPLGGAASGVVARWEVDRVPRDSRLARGGRI